MRLDPWPVQIEYGRGMKMDVIATTKRSVAMALSLVLVIGLLLMAWIGSELHYGNCLTKEHQAGKDRRELLALPLSQAHGAQVECVIRPAA